ncbi:MAG: CorA family divalent cation transporter [Planctomycetota bacterium]
MITFEPMAREPGVLLAASPAGVARMPGEPIELFLEQWRPQPWVWLHLDHNRKAAQRWIEDATPPEVADAMLIVKTRPRCVVRPEGVLFIGRGVNLAEGARPEDMVSIRAWLEPGRLTTVVLRRLRAAEDLAKALLPPDNEAVPNAGALLVMLLERLLDRMAPTVVDVGEAVDELLERVMDDGEQATRREATDLRLRTLVLRRYVVPLRDALTELNAAPRSLIDADAARAIQELADRATRVAEDLELHGVRAETARQELSGQDAERLNRRLYGLAIISAVFLPLGFLTGVLGINVAGVPFTTQPWAFAFWCGVGLLFVALEIGVLKWARWL